MTAVQHFLQLQDLPREVFDYLLQRAKWLKTKQRTGAPPQTLSGKSLAMIFEKSSTRTRVSFEVGIYQLGGHALFMHARDSQLGRGESIADTAKTLSRMVDIVAIRTYEQDIIETFAENASIPVINGLTNQHHPCQILADIFTYQEHRGSIAGATVAWIGDGNNVAHSWLQAAPIFDFKFHIASPKAYALAIPDKAEYHDHVEIFAEPQNAARDADLVITDVCVSMGCERETRQRRSDFLAYTVNAALMRLAKPGALFMHCLPAHRGEEVSAEVIDGPQSVVWDEAENRLHTQKALMEYLLLGKLEH